MQVPVGLVDLDHQGLQVFGDVIAARLGVDLRQYDQAGIVGLAGPVQERLGDGERHPRRALEFRREPLRIAVFVADLLRELDLRARQALLPQADALVPVLIEISVAFERSDQLAADRIAGVDEFRFGEGADIEVALHSTIESSRMGATCRIMWTCGEKQSVPRTTDSSCICSGGHSGRNGRKAASSHQGLKSGGSREKSPQGQSWQGPGATVCEVAGDDGGERFGASIKGTVAFSLTRRLGQPLAATVPERESAPAPNAIRSGSPAARTTTQRSNGDEHFMLHGECVLKSVLTAAM